MMDDSDSDQPPSLVYSSESDEDDNEYSAEPMQHGLSWNKQLRDIIRIRVLAPFLFAGQFGSDSWIRLLINVGLLHKDWLSSNEVATPSLAEAVDLMENIAHCVTDTLMSEREHILARSLLDSLAGKPTIKDVLPAVSNNQLIDQLREKLTKQPEDGDRDKVTLALLYACHQYEACLLESKRTDVVKEFDKKLELEDKSIENLKTKGNTEYKNQEFVKSVGFYTAALTKSRFNYVLYANRSQAYLKLTGNDWLALVDAKRSIILNGKYIKAHHRYVMAWQNLNQTERALQALKLARKLDMSDDDRIINKNWIKKLENELSRRCHSKYNAVEDRPQDIHLQHQRTNSRHADVIQPSMNGPAEDFDEDMRSDEGSTCNSAASKKSTKKTRVKEVVKVATKSDRERSDSESLSTPAAPSANTKTGNKPPKKLKVETKSDETVKTPPVVTPRAMPGLRTPLENLRACAAQGTRFYMDMKMSNAVQAYKRAVDAMTSIVSQGKDKYGDSDRAMLLYSLATALMESGSKKDIADAVKTYTDIVDSYKSVKIPIVYLGLGRAYFLQTRFDESEAMLRRGLKECHQQKVVNWPGTNEAVNLTKEANLKEALNFWIISCHNPPPPIAKCRVPKSRGHMKVNIYLDDPDFRGFVRIMCYLECNMEYHLDCWKKRLVDDFNRCSDKELINAKCFTPDCRSLIRSINFYDKEGYEKRRIDGQKPDSLTADVKIPKQVVKMGKSERKLRAVQERKLRNQQHKREIREARLREEEANRVDAAADLIEQMEQATATGDAVVLPPGDDIVKYATVLKKEESPKQNLENAATRKKKKKDRKVMTLGEFVGNQEDDEDEDCLGWEADQYIASSPPHVDAAMGIDQFDMPTKPRTYPLLDMDNPFTVPEALRENLDIFEQSLGHKARVVPPVDLAPERIPRLMELNERIPRLMELNLHAPLPPPAPQTQPEASSDNSSIKDFLYSFFHDILERHGPLNVDDVNITHELEEFPAEALDVISAAGGIGQFLSLNIQFTMVEDVVCLIQDEPKARVIGQENKKSLVEKYRLELARTMASMPAGGKGKSKKKKKKGGDRVVDYKDIPRAVDLRDDDLLSEKSWPGSETSTQSGASGAVKVKPSIASNGGKVFDANDLCFSRSPTVSSSLSDVSLGASKDVFNRFSGSASAGRLNTEFDNKHSPDWSGDVNGVVHPPGLGRAVDSPAARSVNSSTSNGSLSKTDYSQEDAAVEYRTNMLDNISDDDYSSLQSDTPSSTNKRDRDIDLQGDGLEISTAAVTSPFKNLNGTEPNHTDLFNEPIDLLTMTTIPKKKKKLDKKRNVAKVGAKLKDNNHNELLKINGNSKMTKENGITSDSEKNLGVAPVRCSVTELNVDAPAHVNTPHKALFPQAQVEPANVIPRQPPAQIATSPQQVAAPSPAQQISAHLPVSPPGPTLTPVVTPSPAGPPRQMGLPPNFRPAQILSTNPALSPPLAADMLPPPLYQYMSPQLTNRQKRTSPDSKPTHPGQSSPTLPSQASISPQQLAGPGLQKLTRMPYTMPPNIQGHVFSPSKLVGAPIMMHPKPAVLSPTSAPPNTANFGYPVPSGVHIYPALMAQPPPSLAPRPTPALAPRPTLKEVTTNTDPILFDWKEVDVLMIELENEKRHLAETLEKERKARMELAREQGEQMEQLVTQLANQSMEKADVKATLLSERDDHVTEIGRLQQEITHLSKRINALETLAKSLQASQVDQSAEITHLNEVLDQERKVHTQQKEEHSNTVKMLSEKYGMDMLRAERAEVEFLRYKLEVLLKPFAETALEAERNMLHYANIIKTFTDDGLGAPSELVAVCENWKVLCQKVKDTRDVAQNAVDEQIRRVKGGEPLASLPPLQLPEAPPLPTRQPEQRSNPARPENRRPLGFNAAPGRPSGVVTGLIGGPLQPMAGKTHSKKNSFEKIMKSLTAMFPNYRGTDIKQFILRLRESRGGTLSGLHLQEIVTRVAEMIVEDSRRRITSTGQEHEVSFPAAPSAAPWTPRASLPTSAGAEEEIFEEEEDPCVICHEELKPHNQISGDCGHRFHDNCIRRWLKEQSTCPTCRKHFLLQDDFPVLK